MSQHPDTKTCSLKTNQTHEKNQMNSLPHGQEPWRQSSCSTQQQGNPKYEPQHWEVLTLSSQEVPCAPGQKTCSSSADSH